MGRRLGEIGEAEVIRLFAEGGPPPGSEVLVPNGDDAFAFVPEPGSAVVATTDSLVERTHFLLEGGERERYLPEEIGRKWMRVNLSDLAAMGADPRSALLSVHAAATLEVDVLAGIAAGVKAEARAHGVYIAGGNVTRTDGPLVLAATLLGSVKADAILRKAGAQEGDRLLVTGTLGDARIGLALARDPRSLDALGITRSDAELVLSALKLGRANVIAGLTLADLGACHAVADISDGLGRDLDRMLAPRGLGAELDRAKIPRSSAASSVARALGLDPVAEAIAGGEDYELLIAAAPEQAPLLISAFDSIAVDLTDIGAVSRSARWGAEGFDHFRNT